MGQQAPTEANQTMQLAPTAQSYQQMVSQWDANDVGFHPPRYPHAQPPLQTPPVQGGYNPGSRGPMAPQVAYSLASVPPAGVPHSSETHGNLSIVVNSSHFPDSRAATTAPMAQVVTPQAGPGWEQVDSSSLAPMPALHMATATPICYADSQNSFGMAVACGAANVVAVGANDFSAMAPDRNRPSGYDLERAPPMPGPPPASDMRNNMEMRNVESYRVGERPPRAPIAASRGNYGRNYHSQSVPATAYASRTSAGPLAPPGQAIYTSQPVGSVQNTPNWGGPPPGTAPRIQQRALGNGETFPHGEWPSSEPRPTSLASIGSSTGVAQMGSIQTIPHVMVPMVGNASMSMVNGRTEVPYAQAPAPPPANLGVTYPTWTSSPFTMATQPTIGMAPQPQPSIAPTISYGSWMQAQESKYIPPVDVRMAATTVAAPAAPMAPYNGPSTHVDPFYRRNPEDRFKRQTQAWRDARHVRFKESPQVGRSGMDGDSEENSSGSEGRRGYPEYTPPQTSPSISRPYVPAPVLPAVMVPSLLS